MTQWLENLWKMLSDDGLKEWIRWNEAGDGVVIPSMQEFENNVLLVYGKSPKETFLRNLSHYRFIKQSGRYLTYSHPAFLRSNPNCVHEIQRPSKTATAMISVRNNGNTGSASLKMGGGGSSSGRVTAKTVNDVILRAMQLGQASLTSSSSSNSSSSLFLPKPSHGSFQGNPDMRMAFLEEENNSLKLRVEELENQLLHLQNGGNGDNVLFQEVEEDKDLESSEIVVGTTSRSSKVRGQTQNNTQQSSTLLSESQLERSSRKRPRGKVSSSSGIPETTTESYTGGGEADLLLAVKDSTTNRQTKNVKSKSNQDGVGITSADMTDTTTSPYPPMAGSNAGRGGGGGGTKLSIRNPSQHQPTSHLGPQPIPGFDLSISEPPTRFNSGSSSVHVRGHGPGPGPILIRHPSYNPEQSPFLLTGQDMSGAGGGYSMQRTNSSSSSYSSMPYNTHSSHMLHPLESPKESSFSPVIQNSHPLLQQNSSVPSFFAMPESGRGGGVVVVGGGGGGGGVDDLSRQKTSESVESFNFDSWGKLPR